MTNLVQDIVIQKVSYNQGLTSIQTIRSLVFQQEQGIHPALEFDGYDRASQHLLAYLQDKPIGTARLRSLTEKRIKFERLSVLKPFRGQGVGSAMLKKGFEIALEQGCVEGVIHAQRAVMSWYERFGFQKVGDFFEEAGILHVKMIKYL